MERAFLIATSVAMLVVVVLMARAFRRPEKHIKSRLAAVAVLLVAAQTAVRYLAEPEKVPDYLLWAAGISVGMVAVLAATGRFHAPR